ncbi:MAG: hypothetical protein HWE27_18265 [Gammaproteobacteria bacterium]|nr:hypothetical protein [Gammaproteobacteria bacterium]
MATYKLAQVMAQTRLLASQYREATGQSLPVTVELARFDAITLLGLKEVPGAEAEATLVDDNSKEFHVQIKGRVIFPGGKSRQMVGQLNLTANWDFTVLVIYNPDYQPTAIYSAGRQIVEEAIKETKNNKRGAMTVAKFKAIGELIWETQDKSDEQSLDRQSAS